MRREPRAGFSVVQRLGASHSALGIRPGKLSEGRVRARAFVPGVFLGREVLGMSVIVAKYSVQSLKVRRFPREVSHVRVRMIYVCTEDSPDDVSRLQTEPMCTSTWGPNAFLCSTLRIRSLVKVTPSSDTKLGFASVELVRAIHGSACLASWQLVGLISNI